MNLLLRGARKAVKTALLSLQPAAPDAQSQIRSAELEGVSIRWPAVLQKAEWHTWVEPLYYGLRARVPVVVQEVAQELRGTVVIELCRGNRSYRVGLNTSDYPNLVHVKGNGGASPLSLEFKMQFRTGGYGVANIVPGGYVSDTVLVDWYARGPSRLRREQRFAYDVYGRFGLEFATEIRARAIGTLRSQSRVQFYGGDTKVSFREFLGEIARSRVCIDLPGNGPFCFRLVNYLAVGACVISPPHGLSMPVPLIDRTHIVYTRPDMSDLIDLCEQYVEDNDAREAIVEASRSYYRRNLYWRSLSDYYLRTMLDKLPA